MLRETSHSEFEQWITSEHGDAAEMEAVAQMVGGVAHDFNNLLQGVESAIQVVQRRFDQGRMDDIAVLLPEVSSYMTRARALTDRLLNLSRPHEDVSPDPVAANSVIASMQTMLRHSLGEGIDLELILMDRLGTTLCDPHQLENAILNLAINARDAMPGGGKLRIETCHIDLGTETANLRKGHYVGICVTDTGHGMSPDVLRRAFEPFFTTKPIGRGTGLGLATTRQFVEQYGGAVSIDSMIGRGTSVLLYLPRETHGADARESMAARFA